ncbi:hypothetical protein ACFL7D_07960 [candidate division KSB1 bacterium]
MVNITVEGDRVVFSVQGLHKVLALKSGIEVSRSHIVSAYTDESVFTFYKGMRVPGTHIPGVITAGTFRKDGKKIFWDVFRKKNAVVVALAEEDYDRFVIEVEDPVAAMNLLNSK